MLGTPELNLARKRPLSVKPKATISEAITSKLFGGE
jgi:hypothetical protein